MTRRAEFVERENARYRRQEEMFARTQRGEVALVGISAVAHHRDPVTGQIGDELSPQEQRAVTELVLDFRVDASEPQWQRMPTGFDEVVSVAYTNGDDRSDRDADGGPGATTEDAVDRARDAVAGLDIADADDDGNDGDGGAGYGPTACDDVRDDVVVGTDGDAR